MWGKWDNGFYDPQEAVFTLFSFFWPQHILRNLYSPYASEKNHKMQRRKKEFVCLMSNQKIKNKKKPRTVTHFVNSYDCHSGGNDFIFSEHCSAVFPLEFRDRTLRPFKTIKTQNRGSLILFRCISGIDFLR